MVGESNASISDNASDVPLVGVEKVRAELIDHVAVSGTD